MNCHIYDWAYIYYYGKNISNKFIQNPETTSYNLRKETEMQQTTSFRDHPYNLLMRSMGSRDCMSPSAKIRRVGALRSDRRTYWRLLYAGHVDLTRARLHRKPIANKNLLSPSKCSRKVTFGSETKTVAIYHEKKMKRTYQTMKS
jgi:hypothetical protein